VSDTLRDYAEAPLASALEALRARVTELEERLAVAEFERDLAWHDGPPEDLEHFAEEARRLREHNAQLRATLNTALKALTVPHPDPSVDAWQGQVVHEGTEVLGSYVPSQSGFTPYTPKKE